MTDNEFIPAAGTWQATLTKSAAMFGRSKKASAHASILLWDGSKDAISEWVDTEDDATELYDAVVDLMGAARKGDASKIKAVAIAVRDNALDLADFDNLSQAYKEASRLTKDVPKQAAEDEAAEAAVESVAAAAPKSSSTPEGAALILLAGGLDEASRLLLDALGADNSEAHRSFLRAISQEIAGRVKPKVAPVKESGPKTGATQATKAKAAPVAKVGATKAKPVSRSKGDPNAKALPPKAVPVKGKPVVKEVQVEDDLEQEISDALDFEESNTEDSFNEEMFTDDAEVEAPAPVKKAVKGRPVVRR